MKRTVMLLLFAIAVASAAPAQVTTAKPTRLRGGDRALLLSGVLRNSQEKEYVFAGEKGKAITFRNSNPSNFDIRLFDPISGFDTEYDSSREFDIELPETAEYIIYIRRKVGGPRSARFRISFRIR